MSDEVLDHASTPVDTAAKELCRTRWLLWLQWVPVSAVGVAFMACGIQVESVSFAVIGLGAACTALGQWFVLRPRLARAGWWVVVTPVGLALGGFVGGATYGAITGAALAILLPHSVKTRASKPSRSRLMVGVAMWPLLVICLGWGILAEPVNVQHLLIQQQLGRRDFSGIRLERADLRAADLRGAVLSGANLGGANLIQARLWQVDLSGANLSDANLRGANLFDADLSTANLRGANLTAANLSGANLNGANLTGAGLTDADLGEADLIGARVSEEQLNQAATLGGATLPDGSVHE